MTNDSMYDRDMQRNAANFIPLSPLSFLRRTADVFPLRTAVVDESTTRTWADTYRRCKQLASALSKRGISTGDTVAVMAPNTAVLLEAHFGVPMCGAVLNALNTRLDSEAIAFILEHGEARVLISDREYASIVRNAVAKLERPILVIDADDGLATDDELIGELNYEQLLEEGDPDYEWSLPKDEWDAISLNYTSGTTGNPKGVVYHHRGAYLGAIGNVVTWHMPQQPVYLWTLPMFHCNGWCFPWAVTALAGTHICLRKVDPEAIFEAIEANGVTHLCGAPIVMNMMAEYAMANDIRLTRAVHMMTAGSAPPSAVLRRMEEVGFDVTHTYGLTEVYGPTSICDWHEEWDQLPADERAVMKARQGVRYEVQEEFTVADPETLEPVPHDGKTMGELVFRGNAVMKGYLKNPDTTAECFKGGYFWTGDLGVVHPDKYVEIRDRSKDIIISGGENISSIEVEDTLYQHPSVSEAAVVAKPDAKWGETPCAFVTLRAGTTATEEEIIEHCRSNLARFKCPKTIVFTELPKTSTGKVQKFVLRDRAREL